MAAELTTRVAALSLLEPIAEARVTALSALFPSGEGGDNVADLIHFYENPLYPKQLLNALQVTDVQEKVRVALKRIDEFIQENGCMYFEPAGFAAEMHDHATFVALEIRGDEARRAIFHKFLRLMHGTVADYPLQFSRPLDFSPELAYITDLKTSPQDHLVTIVRLTRREANIQRLFKEIFECEQESFGKLAGEESKEICCTKKQFHIAALDTHTKLVVGSIYGKRMDADTWHIEMLSRRSNAAMRKIGDRLMRATIEALPGKDLLVGVRKVNAPAALHLYKKHGFCYFSEAPRAYQAPPEPEVTLHRASDQMS